MDKVTTYVKILGAEAVDKYYSNPDGNLYFREKGTDVPFQVCEDFDAHDIKIPLAYGLWEVIFIEGPNLGTNVEVA